MKKTQRTMSSTREKYWNRKKEIRLQANKVNLDFSRKQKRKLRGE